MSLEDMNITRAKKFAIFVFVCLLFLVIFLSAIFLPNTTKDLGKAPTPTPRAILDNGGNIIGSKFNEIIPGQTTQQELFNQQGSPEISEAEKNLDKFLFTDKDRLYNYAWAKDGVVLFTKENLFENSRANDFINVFGNPNLRLYHNYSENLMWYIFLLKGIGIQVSQSDDQVTGLVRFRQQSRESFLLNVAPLAGMTVQKEEIMPEPE